MDVYFIKKTVKNIMNKINNLVKKMKNKIHIQLINLIIKDRCTINNYPINMKSIFLQKINIKRKEIKIKQI